MSNKERAWLKIASKLAETSEENMRHGAVVVLGGAVQGMGINKRTNDPYTHKNLHWLSEHAEMAALRRSKRTQGSTVYVSRVNKRGEERNSRPCPKCMQLLRECGVKKVVYTVDNTQYL